MAALQASPSLRIAGWLLGAACSVVGGYVAARIAKRSSLANGAWSARACIALGMYSWAVGHAPVAAWEHVAGFIVSPVLGALGAYLVQQRLDRPAEPPMPAPTAA